MTDKVIDMVERGLIEFHKINAINWGESVVINNVSYEKTYNNVISEGLKLTTIVVKNPDMFKTKVVELAKKIRKKSDKQIYFQLSKNTFNEKDEKKNIAMLEELCSLSHKLAYYLERDVNFSSSQFL